MDDIKFLNVCSDIHLVLKFFFYKYKKKIYVDRYLYIIYVPCTANQVDLYLLRDDKHISDKM